MFREFYHSSHSWLKMVMPDQHTKQQLLLAEFLSAVLSEPFSFCFRLVSEHHKRHMQFLESRQRKLGSRQERICEQAFHWTAEKDYCDYTRTEKRSRILACYHFGDYLNAYARLSRHTPSIRRRIILRQKASANESRIDNLRKNTFFTDSQTTSALQLTAMLREGNTTAAIFCDLPPANGETVAVRFLGHDARFPRGIAEIALLSGCTILPVITYDQGGSSHIVTGQIMEVKKGFEETREITVQRITQQLVSFLEQHFRQNPSQWQYLHQLPAYLQC